MKENVSNGVLFVLCVLTLMLFSIDWVYAQSSGGGYDSSPIERWAFKTNALEWALTIPNLTAAYDLSSSKYNHDVVQLNLKYNWNTWHQYAPYYVLNIFSVRPEYRRYYRQTQRKLVPAMVPDTAVDPADGKPRMVPKWIYITNPETGRKEKVQDMEWEKATFPSTARKAPKPWRAYYLGAYADYTLYSVKPGQTGRQGWAAGIGVSAGYEIPLYEYKRGAVDLDLGISAGLLVTANKAYQQSEADPYAYARIEHKDTKFFLLPMLTELRAVFSWRAKSVRDKYNKQDPSDKYYQDEKSNIDNDLKGSSKTEFDANTSKRDALRYAQSDSLYRASYLLMLDEMRRDREARMDPRLTESQRKKLLKYMEQGCLRLVKDFDAEMKAAQKEKLEAVKRAAIEKKKAIDAEAAARRKAEKEAVRMEKGKEVSE